MDLLVLGGTRFVGRAVIADALARGWSVTAVHRGVTGAPPQGATSILVDRSDETALAAALGGKRWDAVVDTWSGAPQIAGASARVLRESAQTFGYVSTVSVYVWGEHVDETSPVITGDPHGGEGSYPDMKRGAELAIRASFPDALFARPGLILGPHEDIGRLPWWLDRIARGGPVVAPGRPERPLQYVDARDLAGWLLSALDSGRTGEVDVIGPSGFATTDDLLRACIEVTGSDARPVWIDEATLADAGVAPWTQLPCWVPEQGEFAGFLEADTTHAMQTGLTPRPLRETVADTWRWLQSDGPAPQRPDRDVPGLPEALERSLLAGRG